MSSNINIGGSVGAGLQGQSGQSISENFSQGGSSGGGSSSEYGYSHSADMSESGYSDSSWGQSWSQVFGKEASAADIKRAAEANLKQEEFWALQAAYNMMEAQKSRDFQEYMSNTSYQRAVADLIKAGLNPILAAGNMGASTPVGSMASTGLATAHKATTFADQISSSTWGSSGSGYSKSHGYSKSEKSGQSSYGNSSWNSAYGYDVSQTTNNVRDFMGAMGSLFDSAANMVGGEMQKKLFKNSKNKKSGKY